MSESISTATDILVLHAHWTEGALAFWALGKDVFSRPLTARAAPIFSSALLIA